MYLARANHRIWKLTFLQMCGADGITSLEMPAADDARYSYVISFYHAAMESFPR